MNRTAVPVVLLLCALGAWTPAPPARAAPEISSEELEERIGRLDGLLEARDFESAERDGRALLAVVEAAFGQTAMESGRVIDRIVHARLGTRGTDDGVLALAERAVQIKESSEGARAAETGESLYRLGLVLQLRHRPADAVAPMERAVAIRTEVHGESAPETAAAVARLAFLYRALDRDRDASRLLRETLEALEAQENPDPAAMAPVLYTLALVEIALGEFDAAETHFGRLLDASPEVGRIQAHNGLGQLFVEQARYAEAQEQFESAVEGMRVGGAPRTEIASGLHNLGYVLTEMGDLDEAVRVHGEALSLRLELHGPESHETAGTMVNLAQAFFLSGNADTALVLLEGALAVYERTLGPEHSSVAWVLRELATTYLELGRVEDARTLLDRGLRISRAQLGPVHHDTGKMARWVGIAAARAGDLENAESALREASRILGETLGRAGPEWAEASVELARVLSAAGKADESWKLALEAEEVARRHVRWTAAALSERQALRYAATSKGALDLLLELLLERRGAEATTTAWDRVIRSRAIALELATERRAWLGRAVSAESRSLLRDYERASGRLAALLVRGPEEDGDEYAGLVGSARFERDRAERALAEASGAFRSSLASRGLGLSEVRAALPPGAALVAYVRFESCVEGASAEPAARYGAFVMAAGAGASEFVDLDEADAIEGLVAAWRTEAELPRASSAERAASRYRTAAAELRRAVWDPVASRTGDPTFVVTDGALHRVNLYALPAGESSFLLEEGGTIHYLAAERDLAGGAEAGKAGSGLLAVGGVDFGDSTGQVASSGALPGVRFSPLPETSVEVRALASLWEAAAANGVTLLVGQEASEGAFKRLAPGRHVLHLATHGFFRSEGSGRGRPGTRAIGGVGPRREHAASVVRSLSGLAMAGANLRPADSGGDDGILTAEEIAALDLGGTDWVVLSACDTGLGEVLAGEGVLGLRRAFRVAGARTLVMSLWDVDDAATRQWMQSLYEARLAGATTVEAVRAAGRNVLGWCRETHGTDHPFYWGAFVAAGDWR